MLVSSFEDFKLLAALTNSAEAFSHVGNAFGPASNVALILALLSF